MKTKKMKGNARKHGLGVNMDGIIFDVDGTLWDSTELVAKAWNYVLETETALPPNIDSARLKTLFGKPMDEICLSIFKGIPVSEHPRLGEICYMRENALLYEEPVPLYDGVLEACQELAKRCPLFIVSNCQKGYIEALLDTTPLKPYITGHLCYGDTGKTKDVTMQMLMEQYRLKNVLYVGDTQGDADACQKADVPFVLAEYGFGDAAEPDYRISELKELLELPIWE